MAFTMVSYSRRAKNRLPCVITNIISGFNDERRINRCKFIKNCLNLSEKFKQVYTNVNKSTCLFGINNIVDLNCHNLQIFTRTYVNEIFIKVNPSNGRINRTLKQLKLNNNAANMYQKQKDDFQKIILKKCRRLIRRSVKYSSLDTKIRIANKHMTNKLFSIYKSLIINIDILWKY